MDTEQDAAKDGPPPAVATAPADGEGWAVFNASQRGDATRFMTTTRYTLLFLVVAMQPVVELMDSLLWATSAEREQQDWQTCVASGQPPWTRLA
eukprot:6998671-Lingulodinium_polyedra.AAC.1